MQTTIPTNDRLAAEAQASALAETTRQASREAYVRLGEAHFALRRAKFAGVGSKKAALAAYQQAHLAWVEAERAARSAREASWPFLQARGRAANEHRPFTNSLAQALTPGTDQFTEWEWELGRRENPGLPEWPAPDVRG